MPVEWYASAEWCGMPRLECGVSPLPVARSPSLKWCVPRSGRFVPCAEDHCVSLRVFASSRETNAAVCPRFAVVCPRFGRQQEAWWEVGSAPVVMRGARVCSVKTETAMIRQEGESSPSVVSNGSTLIADPLLVEPRAGTIPSGVFPKCELPHVTQHCGAEGWVFNRDRPFDVPFRKNSYRTEFFADGGSDSRLSLPVRHSYTSHAG